MKYFCTAYVTLFLAVYQIAECFFGILILVTALSYF